MRKYFRLITTTVLLSIIIGLCIINPFHYTVKAIESDNVFSAIELKPSFSALTVDITEPLIISYEDIDLDNYECSIDADGVSVSIIDSNNYLQCEVEANNNVEFGTLTVRAVALDGTELTDTIYTYNNGEKLFYSEFAKDQAWYDGTKELFDQGLEWFTYRYWEEEYSELMSSILSGEPYVQSNDNNETTISGKIQWERDSVHNHSNLINAYVEIIEKNDYDYVVLDSGFTDKNGQYNLEISNMDFSQNSNVYLRINLESYTFKVRSGWHTFPYYFDTKLSGVINAGDFVEYDPVITYDNSMKIYKATYVHQAMTIAERFAQDMGFKTTNKIRVAYPAGIEDIPNVDSLLEILGKSAFCWGNGEDNCYCAIGWYSWNSTKTMVHEYSHYIQCSMGNYGEDIWEILIENPNHDGESDYYVQKEDKSFAMHLSWTEGWGEVFSVMAQKYYESEYSGLNNRETNILERGDLKGEFQENSIKQFLWSLLDYEQIDCEIDNENVALDYQLPWTPQEWWNMTTVRGTCRLPDFIGLVENEEYNVGADLDYKEIKAYLSEKLTKYKIAPQISSAVVSEPNQSPIIEWIPNGSSEIGVDGNPNSNNRFYVNILDSNKNLVYRSEELNGSEGYSYQIDQEYWNSIISDLDCEDKVYISIEAYRYDIDENNEEDISGPYYSEYYIYAKNNGHDFDYVSVDKDAHKYICYTCDLEREYEHILSGMNLGVVHKASCGLCGYTEESSHELTCVSQNDKSHLLKCNICDFESETDHTNTCNSLNNTDHKYTCLKCDYSQTEPHNFEQTDYHTKVCSDCGYSVTSSHTLTCKSLNDSYHVLMCTQCGETVGSATAHSWVLANDTGLLIGEMVRCQFCGCLKILGPGEVVPVIKNQAPKPDEESE